MSALPVSELTVNQLPVCEGPALLRDRDEIVPPVPETIDDAGLSESIIEQLILKNLFFRSEILGRELASLIGFKYRRSARPRIRKLFPRRDGRLADGAHAVQSLNGFVDCGHRLT
jgi:hypothetical protein